MKYCEEYAALISAWLDGELDERQAARLHIHLFTCPGCRAYLADMQAMRKGFPKLEDVEVPEGFTQAVMDRVHKAATAPPHAEKEKQIPLYRPAQRGPCLLPGGFDFGGRAPGHAALDCPGYCFRAARPHF